MFNMTTIKQILTQFNSKFRYNDQIESLDIGDYSFDKAYRDKTGYVMEFINTQDSNYWLRINDDSNSVLLIKKVSDDTVNVTSWRYGKKFVKDFPYDQFKPYGSDTKPFLTN